MQDGSITGVKIADNTIPDAKLVQTGGVLSSVNKLHDDLYNGLTIENYEHPYVEDETSVTSGAYYSKRGNVVPIATYSYKKIECEPNTTYLVGGTNGTDARLYIVLDASENIIDMADSSTQSGYFTVEYTTSSNAKYLIVNCYNSIGTPSIKALDALAFVLPSSGGLVVIRGEGNQYTIGGDVYSNVVNLSGSNNGLFDFVSITRGGSTYKNCSDDVAPVNLVGAGYVGGNHGYYFGYECVVTSHGLTETDIGKTTTDGTNTWVLLKIASVDSVIVGCYDDTVWYRLKTVAPTTLDFGTSLAVESATRVQLWPSVKNGNVSIIEESPYKFVVLETYDIIEIGSGIDALIVGVGTNTNDSLVNLSDSAVTVRNMYEFHENGSVTIYQNLKVLNDYVGIDYYGGAQSKAFGASDSYSVPQTTKNGIFSVDGTRVDFERSTWNDLTVPPTVYIQYNGDMSKAMLTGFIGNNRNTDIDSSGGFMGTTGKMYPYMVNPDSTLDAGKTYSMVSYRVPAISYEHSTSVVFVWHAHVYDDIYLIVRSNAAANASIKLPEFMWGKRCEVVMAENMTCETTNIIDSLDVRGTQYGTLVAKLAD